MYLDKISSSKVVGEIKEKKTLNAQAKNLEILHAIWNQLMTTKIDRSIPIHKSGEERSLAIKANTCM